VRLRRAAAACQRGEGLIVGNALCKFYDEEIELVIAEASCSQRRTWIATRPTIG